VFSFQKILILKTLELFKFKITDFNLLKVIQPVSICMGLADFDVIMDRLQNCLKSKRFS